jgi:LruC domain-containing protein
VWNQAGLAFQNCPYIIYNFYNTTNLQIEGNSTIEGTILAPFAEITKTANQSNIEGQVIGLSFNHGGGANRYSVYMPKLAVADADGDGVADADDNYPNDVTKAFDNKYPGKGFSTLLFEDLWPYTGDYDFNDLVIDYNFNTITNAAGNVAEINYTFLPKAAGASFRDGFAFQLDGIPSDKIASVKGSKMSAGWSRLNSNGTEEGHKSGANIIVFDDVYKVFNGLPAGGSAINTFSAGAHYSADTITVSIKFVANGVPYASLGSAKFNPYLIVDQKRGKEIHLTDRTPSDKMDHSFFGLGDDASSAATGKYFSTKNNLPWALNLAGAAPYPQEKVDFTSVYLTFIKWAMSGGKSNTDWYLNNSGNRDDSKIYKY